MKKVLAEGSFVYCLEISVWYLLTGVSYEGTMEKMGYGEKNMGLVMK